ncbi:M56 family metallopeptidase [Phormidium tenue FACHB-886]|nr:M56 family metallopeptidase [Phormidium tenue FACHB-886]
MHISLMLLATAIAGLSRCLWHPTDAAWSVRWRHTLSAFLLPPLLLMMTAIAVLCMGTEGEMLGLPVGWIGYLLAIGCLTMAAGVLLRLAWQAGRSLQQLQTYPVQPLSGVRAHILDTPRLFAAQVGFWQPKLVVSQGMLTHLTPAQLAAVLTHEQAHAHYRDTFWFFWLGWLRHLTTWLPNTHALWEDLLLLRELRADQWAAQHIDPLLLAESLLLAVQEGETAPDYCAALSATAPLTRLETRIEALLATSSPDPVEEFSLAELWVAIVPLLTLLVHR